MNVRNLIHSIFETKHSPYAQILRTSFWTKLKNTHVFFAGNDHYVQDYLNSLRTTYQRTIGIKAYDEYPSYAAPKAFEKRKTHGLISFLFVNIPFAIVLAVFFMIPYLLSMSLKSLSVYLANKNKYSLLRSLLFGIGHVIQSLIEVSVILFLAPITFIVRPFVFLLSVPLTMLVAPIVGLVALATRRRADHWKQLFYTLPFQKTDGVEGLLADDEEMEIAALVEDSSNQNLLDNIWSNREAYTQVVAKSDERFDSDYFAFYSAQKDPQQDEPDFILFAKDIAQNTAAFRAMLHLNMFNFLAENEDPSYPYISQEEKITHPQEVGGPDGKPSNYLLNWLSQRGVKVDLEAPFDLSAALGLGYERI